MIRLTAKAALTNFNVTYFVVLVLGVLTFTALFAPDGEASAANLLMSHGLVAAAVLGLLAGTTLVEIKVKPLSYVLPGQERSMALAMLLVGIGVSLAFTLLVAIRPMSMLEAPAAQQALATFGFSLGVFMLVVAICVVTRDTSFTSLVALLPLLFLFAARGAHEGGAQVRESWIELNAALAASPVLSIVAAALGVGIVFGVLGSRSLSRTTCGAPFLPLKAYDNPFRMDEVRSRMMNGSFRPSVMTRSSGGPGSIVLGALSRRFAGTSWDYLVLDTRVSRNRWEFAFRLVNFLVVAALILPLGRRGSPYGAGPVLLLIVAVTFIFFAPLFKPRLSPMLPVSRRQHFRSFIVKALSIYGFTILVLLFVQLAAGMFRIAMPGPASDALAGLADMPFKGVLIVAGVVPVLCWAYTKLRSTVGFLLFMIVFLGFVVNPALRVFESLLELSHGALLLASAIAWLPFFTIAWKRCCMDDLLRP